MKIAIIGSGIAGMGAAWRLSKQHQVVLFEKESRLGGHTHTHDVEQDGKRYQVDTGFIVQNPGNYPLLNKMFDEIGVQSQETLMSFAVRNEATGLEYNATDMNRLFSQRRNLVSPKFWRMVLDIPRFYRECPTLLSLADDGPSLGDYLRENKYSEQFARDHLIPMASALWSSPSNQILDFPAKYLVQFMDNHHMLRINDRPQWKVVKGGSSRYIDALQKHWTLDIRLNAGVQSIKRAAAGVQVHFQGQEELFDQVILACHSDQALSLLSDADSAERDILGAIGYQPNEVILHTDRNVLPKNPKAWAAWNVHVPREAGNDCTVSYCMNILQSLQSREPFVVSLNQKHLIDSSKILARMNYSHPIFTHQSVAAQKRKAEIQGKRNTWFAGAYWGHGFHEDGLRSAIEVTRALGDSW
jgi:uncharacterized protein